MNQYLTLHVPNFFEHNNFTSNEYGMSFILFRERIRKIIHRLLLQSIVFSPQKI